MKFKFKKLTAMVSAIAVTASMLVVPGFASADDFVSLSSAVGYVYDYVDGSDEIAVQGTGSKLAELINVDNVNSQLDVSSLLTTNFKNNYGSENAAKQALITLLGTSLSVYYSKSEAELQQALLNAESIVKPILQKGLSVDEAVADDFVEKWFDLFLLTRKDAQDSAHTISGMLPVWASGNLSSLFEAMDKMQVKAMKDRLNADTEEKFGKIYSDVKAAIDNMDWTVENLVAVSRQIINFVDSSNAGEFALIKAAARSSAEMKINENAVNLEYAGKDLEAAENIYKIDPDTITADTDYEIKLNVMGREVTNLVKYYSSNPELVIMDAVDQDEVIIMTVKSGAKGTADVVLGRDPGSEKDWITKIRVVVAYDIAKADAPVWSSEDEGVVSWTAVPNATKYVVNLYKYDETIGEDVVVATKEIDGATTADLSEEISNNGNGEYKATVTAYGDIAEEVGEESEKSAALSHTESLNQVAKPSWKDGTKTLEWNAVDNATQYTIYLYKGKATVPFKTVTVDAVVGVNSLDCTSLIGDSTGTFYAVVQAKSADKVGAPSPKSDGLLVEALNTITGNVKLEAYRLGETQEDNSGIKVTLQEDDSITVVTGADGNYTLTGKIPDGEYTLIFEKKYYLKKKVTFNVSGGEVIVDDVVLLYGDFKNSTGVGINIIDVSVIISYQGALEGVDAVFDTGFDIDKDGVITGNEMSVVMRNYGEAYLN